MDKRNNLWLGSNGNGLMRLDKNCFQLYPFAHHPLTKPWVLTIATGNNDRLWLGTWGSGLLSFDTRSMHFTDYNGNIIDRRYADSDKISVILPENEDLLWLGTCGAGLVKYDVRRNVSKRFLKSNGLVDESIYSLLLDDYNNLWIATSNGLSRFDQRTSSFSNYAINDGLQGMSFNLGAGCRLRDGTLLFGGNNGFNYFVPRGQLNPVAPHIVLQEISVYGEKRELPEAGNLLRFSSADKSIAFTFAGLHYKNPEKNTYAYMLEGFDKKWNYCGTRRQAFYTNLSPGRYMFRVKASNADGLWNEADFALPLEIDVPFFQSRMFWVGGAMLLSVSAYSVFQFRLRRLRMLENARRLEREQIARDFHDGFGHRATKVSWFVQMLKREAESNASAKEYLGKIEEGLSDLYIESRAFMWEMNEHKKSLYDLVVELKNHADYLFDDARVSFSVQGLSEEVQKIVLTNLERRNLLYIFKEGMHNIIKHAGGCRNVSFKVLPDQDQWTMLLEDDGDGFDGNISMAGQGMCNMKKRAEELAVDFYLNSAPGKGTKVVVCKTTPRGS
jgi:signal transduction histidine kinase